MTVGATADVRVPTGRGDSARPGVIAIIPRGEVIRNFVYTGALDTIAGAADLTVISVLPNREFRELLDDRYPRVVELQQPREHYAVGLTRDVLDMAHNRWLWSEAAKERWRLRRAEVKSSSDLAKLWAKRAACYPFTSGPGLRVLSAIESSLTHKFRTSNFYVDMYRRNRPAIVFNGSHVHSRIAVAAVNAAKHLKIPTATFVFSWDNLTSQGRMIPEYDYYFVWNDAIRQDLLRMYPNARPDNVIVTGTPQFDTHFRPEFHWSREEFCRNLGLDGRKRFVLYSTGMANHMPGEPVVVEEIADMLREFPDAERAQLVVRVYPKDQTGRFDELRRRRPDIHFPQIPWEAAWLTPRYEDAWVLANMLRHCDLGINVASTVSLELCMFDKPVINVGYNPTGVDVDVPWARYYEFDHYKPVVQSGAVQMAWSVDQMRQRIHEALGQPALHQAARRNLVQRMFGDTLDGRSSDRVASEILRVAERQRSL